MNATKHTPGPWHTGTTANTKYSIYERFGQQIAESFAGVFIGNTPSAAREANARLIAAAPELLEALEQCRIALEPYDDVKPRDWKTDREKLAFAHQAARAAIAKATGDEN